MLTNSQIDYEIDTAATICDVEIERFSIALTRIMAGLAVTQDDLQARGLLLHIMQRAGAMAEGERSHKLEYLKRQAELNGEVPVEALPESECPEPTPAEVHAAVASFEAERERQFQASNAHVHTFSPEEHAAADAERELQAKRGFFSKISTYKNLFS